MLQLKNQMEDGQWYIMNYSLKIEGIYENAFFISGKSVTFE
jgi:hypothetical protein